MNRFGKLLRKARKRAGLTQPELAEKVGVNKSYISKLETGVFSPPSRQVAHKLADALGLNDKVMRLKFLFAAGAASDEDAPGLPQGEGEEHQSGEHEDEADATRLYTLAHAAMALPDSLFGTTGGEIDRLIEAADLSEEDEEQIADTLVEITKLLLALAKTKRGT
jgi:transcriptional regulator with XRE-family HTH domain